MGKMKNLIMLFIAIGVLFAGVKLYGGDPFAFIIGFFSNLGDWIASIPFMRKILGAP